MLPDLLAEEDTIKDFDVMLGASMHARTIFVVDGPPAMHVLTHVVSVQEIQAQPPPLLMLLLLLQT